MQVQMRTLAYRPGGNWLSSHFSSAGLLAAALLAASAPALCAQTPEAQSSDSPVVRVVGGARDPRFDVERNPSGRAVGPRADPTQTFRFTGEAQTVTVPEGANEAVVRVVGAKGGRTEGGGDGSYYTGGDGAQVTGRFSVTPGQTLSVFVGEYGGDGELNKNPGKGGIGITGRGGRGGGGQNRDGAGGGGASGISLGDQTLIIAGSVPG